MLRSALAVLILTLGGTATAGPRLLAPEASAGLGVEGVAYDATNGRWGDLFLAPDLAGRVLFGGLALDGDLLLSVPLAGGGASFGGNLTARLGWSGERWSLLLGPVLAFAPTTTPALQVLPSVRAAFSFGAWGLSAGLFDQHGLAIGHLSAELGDYSIGYVAPLGGRAAANFHLGQQLAVRAEALVMFAFNTRVAYLGVSGVFEPGLGGVK